MSEGKLNILFVGNLKGSSTSIFYYQSLIQRGHVVYPFEPHYYSGSFPDRVSIKLNRRPTRKTLHSVHEPLLKIIERNSFDIVFIFNENFFNRDFIETARRKSKKSPIFIYHSHDNLFAPEVIVPKEFLKALSYFDYVFTTKSQNVAEYKKWGQERSMFLPAAFEPSVHRPIEESTSRFGDKVVDVTFVGTFDKSRLSVLTTIGLEKVHIWGEHWQKYKEFEKYKKTIHPRGIYFLEYADVLSHSLISLGLLREEAFDLHTQRNFEIPACMSLQISPRNEELRSFFIEDEEIVLFTSLTELKDKVDFYLKNTDAREKIIRRAFEKIYFGKHTYWHRVEHILEIVGVGHKRIPVKGLSEAA